MRDLPDAEGAVDAAWITNTCTIRMSRSFNYSGAKIPGNYPGLTTVKGKDGLRYAFRVAETLTVLDDPTPIEELL